MDGFIRPDETYVHLHLRFERGDEIVLVVELPVAKELAGMYAGTAPGFKDVILRQVAVAHSRGVSVVNMENVVALNILTGTKEEAKALFEEL